MLLEDALNLAKRLIETGECHRDHKRTTDIADTYRTYITGDGIGKKLIQYTPREEKTMFDQRCTLTRSTTPAVASSIRQPFNKVVRNDRIRKTIKMQSENRENIVKQMMLKFYGSARKKNKGLEYWLKTRFVELQFIDPNSWVVMEWDAPQTASEVIQVRPFEVNSTMAKNFFVVNDEVKWLFVEQEIKFKSATPTATASTGLNQSRYDQTPAQTTAEVKGGKRFTLYDEEITIVFEQVSRDVYALQPGEVYSTIKENDYVVRVFTPKIGYVPAFRIGYKRDEQTNGRTFVNPWHDALCYFDKSLKTVSELDITMTLHAFPQKLQYVQKCPGRLKEGTANNYIKCNSGLEQGTGQTCQACKGTGYKVHTTGQDIILLPMPDTKEEIIPLDSILSYKSPPLDLVKFQNDYCQQLERQAHQAVFNSQVFVKKAAGGSGAPIQTATEADFNMQSVYDALEPFTEKLSEMWRELVVVMAIIAGDKLENIDVSHDFPADYKLKTGDILLSERKTATDSGAPAFLIETIDEDLATIIYAGDTLGLIKYRTKRRFFPFSGKGQDEIALLLASEFVPEDLKIIYCNFDQIFKDIELEDPNFWSIANPADQKVIFDKVVEQWKLKISPPKPAPTFQLFRPTAADGTQADATQTAADGTPANGTQQPAAAGSSAA